MAGKSDLGDTNGSNIFRVAGGAIASAPDAGQNAAETFGANTPIDGMRWWWRGSRQSKGRKPI